LRVDLAHAVAFSVEPSITPIGILAPWTVMPSSPTSTCSPNPSSSIPV
jgi:hypothetical protein